MAKIQLMGTALVAAALVAGCGQNQVQVADDGEAMVVVNGKILTRNAIDADVEKILAFQGDKIPTNQLEYARRMFANQVAQSFLVENVLAAKATELGYLVTDEDIKEREAEFLKQTAGMPDAPKSLEEAAAKSPLGKERALAEMKAGILIDKMLKAEAIAKDTQDYSKQAKDIIAGIVSNNAEVASSDAAALKKIKDLKAVLDGTPADQKAAKFGELAKENSDCPSKDRNGDLGTFQHGQMVKEFDEAAFALAKGQISDIVKTQFGYHLILLTEKSAAVEAKDDQPAQPETVKASHILVAVKREQQVPKEEEIINHLKKQGERAIIANFIESNIRAANIQVADEYKNLLPPQETTEVPVETPAEK